MIYLASPYSHENPLIRTERYVKVSRLTSKLLNAGHNVFCPIAYSHNLVHYGASPEWKEVWERFDLQMLERCDELWVLTLKNWRDSLGVKAEINFAKSLDMSIKYCDNDGYFVDVK